MSTDVSINFLVLKKMYCSGEGLLSTYLRDESQLHYRLPVLEADPILRCTFDVVYIYEYLLISF